MPKGDARLQAAEREIGGEMIVRRVCLCRYAVLLRKKEKIGTAYFFLKKTPSTRLFPPTAQKGGQSNQLIFIFVACFRTWLRKIFLGQMMQAIFPFRSTLPPNHLPNGRAGAALNGGAKTRLLIFFFLSLPNLLPAQYKFDAAIRLDREKGLPSNAVFCIRKGPDGFVWIGTNEGLCRFDGARIKVYQNAPDDSTSLLGTDVYSVLPTSERIWVATESGVSALDLRRDQFVRYQMEYPEKTNQPKHILSNDANVLYQDKKGVVWVGTQLHGVGRYVAEQDRFEFFAQKANSLQEISPTFDGTYSVLSLADATHNDSIIFAGTVAGLLEINKYTKQVQWHVFTQADKKWQTAVNAFRKIHCHDNGLLYAGSWGAGVHIFDPARKTLVPLPVKSSPGSSILRYAVQSILRKTADEIWITTGGGLVVYHIGRQEIVFWKKNNLATGEYFGVEMVDESNRVWNRSVNGIHIFDPAVQQFARYHFGSPDSAIQALAFYLQPAAGGNGLFVLPRFDGNIYHFDLQNHTWNKISLAAAGKNFTRTFIPRAFARAPNGSFTISADNGLFSFLPKSNKLSRLPFQPSLKFRRFGSIIWDKSGHFWLCAGVEGLFRWNPRTKEVRVFKKELESPQSPGPVTSIGALFEDSRGHLWLARTRGFSVRLPERDTFLHFIFPEQGERTFQQVHDFVEDRYGRVWLHGPGSWVGYALAEEPERGIVKKMDLKILAGINDLYGLTTDAQGDIWGYSKRILLKINAADLSVTTYSFAYGVGEADFFSFKFLPGGNLVFGGRNEIVVARPEDLQRNKELPRPYLSEISVLGKPRPDTLISAEQPVLRLQHWENFFSFAFSAQAFTLGEHCRFRYRLFDFENWTETGDRRYANFTNVPGGDYVFQLQVANNEGVWSKTMLELPVHVSTAWWTTWWFRITLGLGLLGLVYQIYRNRVLQIRRQERIKSDFEKRLANVEMSALLAQMNPHFLFNSLNSIDNYIIRNDTVRASEYLNNFARLMRLILNNSRTNYISLKDELETLDLYLQMESLRFKDKFQYNIQVDESLDPASVNIPPMLIQPYVENAIWHGLMHREGNGATGQVNIEVVRRGDNLVCTVEDNGIGREKAGALQAKRSTNNRSQSMGTRITEERIEIINKLYQLNAHVQFHDLHDGYGEPSGTRVELTIPL